MFDSQQIESRGFSLTEIAMIGCASAVLMLLFDCLCAPFTGKGFWMPLSDWPTLRNALGVAVGILVLGSIASRCLRLYWMVQLLAMFAVTVGLGQVLALAVEALVRRLLHAMG